MLYLCKLQKEDGLLLHSIHNTQNKLTLSIVLISYLHTQVSSNIIKALNILYITGGLEKVNADACLESVRLC